MEKVEIDYLGKKLIIESDHMAKQADGSVVVKYGDTVVLAAATARKGGSEKLDFFPLTCVYQVRAYSQGKIIGGFIKRERMPSEMEVLSSRIIDRSLRPFFHKDFSEETQVIATVLSYDETANPIVAATLGASAALLISDIPYEVPIAGINIGRINGEFVVNPSPEDLKESDINLFVAAREESIVMVESENKEATESDLVKALEFAFDKLKPLLEIQKKLLKKVGKKKRPVEEKKMDATLIKTVSKLAKKKLEKALFMLGKLERLAECEKIKKEVCEKTLSEDEQHNESEISEIISDLKKDIIRKNILKNNKRLDGRSLADIRPVTCEIGMLPKTHGSALFTRGETQALLTTTLGTKNDEQMVDDPSGLHYKNFYLHYNFPAYSVGEVRRLGAPGRREIGHGNLAERSLINELPLKDNFPYTIRVVSEITESDGSSSMATVCGASLSLMDAGVPLKNPVAGVAMGLITEGKKTAILTDILSDEDQSGDMDFKVVGTANGVNALQLDIKTSGLSSDLIRETLEQAKEARLKILEKMNAAIENTRDAVAQSAPRFIRHRIPPYKIKDLIGPGGKVIKGIQVETGSKIEVEDSGIITISSADQKSAERALALVKNMTQDVEVGTVYEGEIKRIMDFGAFVEILANTQGLVHISEVSKERINRVEDILEEGQIVKVKAIGYDKRGKLRLSMKAVD